MSSRELCFMPWGNIALVINMKMDHLNLEEVYLCVQYGSICNESTWWSGYGDNYDDNYDHNEEELYT